jgi:transposase
MVAVMIGVDPHKGLAYGGGDQRGGRAAGRVAGARLGNPQVEQLLAWAAPWPGRTWAIEGADGTGHLLAQQLLTAGERVLDIQPKLSARVRLLAAGNVNKNDPNDARSVAVAALRSGSARAAAADDHAAVLGVWAKRHRDLGRLRTQLVCRLHAVLCELLPGGVGKQLTAGHAARLLASITPADAVAAARRELAAQFVADLRGIDAQMRDTKKKLAVAVAAAGTSLTVLFRVGPVIAAAVISDVRDVSRFPDRDHFAAWNGTAPVEVSSGRRKIYRLSRRGNRRLNHAIHITGVTQIRYAHSPGRAYYDKKRAEGKTGKEALRCLKRQISDAIFACLRAGAQRTAAPAVKGPGGQPGHRSASRAAGSHPARRLFGQATPGPATHPTTPASGFPAPLPSRANGRPGPGPGAARPRSGARRASSTRPGREPIMPATGKQRPS